MWCDSEGYKRQMTCFRRKKALTYNSTVRTVRKVVWCLYLLYITVSSIYGFYVTKQQVVIEILSGSIVVDDGVSDWPYSTSTDMSITDTFWSYYYILELVALALVSRELQLELYNYIVLFFFVSYLL